MKIMYRYEEGFNKAGQEAGLPGEKMAQAPIRDIDFSGEHDGCCNRVHCPESGEDIKDALIRQHDEEYQGLEQQLITKKGELARMLLYLRGEKEKRRRLEESLHIKEIELKRVSSDLAEAHTTLKVLLDRTREEKKEFADRLMADFKHGVFPYLHLLKGLHHDEKAKEYVCLIESHLKAITSPFSESIACLGSEFTPMEIQVADLVREGKTTKEISALLNLSDKAVEFHRNNIRDKLGLKNKKVGLKHYLASIPRKKAQQEAP